MKTGEVGGPVARSAPYWLLAIALGGMSMMLAWQHPGYVLFVYSFAVMVAGMVLAVSSAWRNGATAMMQETVNAYNSAAEAIAQAHEQFEEMQPQPLRLTGGGPMDGTTIPHPATLAYTEAAEGQVRLVVADSETEEVLGAYLQDPDRPDRMIWQEDVE